jgi:NAD(P)-dependent dehydrogenase (short-subunit alcohol dehydrogenase family)
VQSSAWRLKGKNIRVNTVCPGFIATDLTQPAINALNDMNPQAALDQNPLERFGEPIEVSKLTLYTCVSLHLSSTKPNEVLQP